MSDAIYTTEDMKNHIRLVKQELLIVLRDDLSQYHSGIQSSIKRAKSGSFEKATKIGIGEGLEMANHIIQLRVVGL